jgi:hypothetical protein
MRPRALLSNLFQRTDRFNAALQTRAASGKAHITQAQPPKGISEQVIPAEAGIQAILISLDSGFHRSDEPGVVQSFPKGGFASIPAPG